MASGLQFAALMLHRYALMVILTIAPLGASASPPPPNQLRTAIARSPLRNITLYRGASAQTAFGPKTLSPVNTPKELTRAVGSRLMSSSKHVSGLTSSPYTAGCFALGVKDGQPESVRIFGANQGFIGVTKGKLMAAERFVQLVGQNQRSLPRLLKAMGECNVVVDATQLTQKLGDRYPGILTRGFQEMINTSLQREAEYFCFGREPGFSRVVPVTKDNLVRQDGLSTRFQSDLGNRLAP